MIVRHIPMKTIKKSSFAGLIQYMTSEQGKQERLGEISITNCQSNDVEWATHEIEATQHQNQRALGDKTYHLLISFPAGEVPAADVLKDIEERVSASLGFTGHQRISVIHHDTDNFHIHIGINKINPVTYTLHEPYLAYKKLAEIATTLEIEHGLQITNHIPNKTGSENRADDMEHHAGVESLLNWVKQACTNQIHNAQNWSEIHSIMQSNGLEIRERGQGLIITDGTGIAVKASSVSRDFSKAKLENRLGLFQGQTSRQSTRKPQAFKKPGVGKIGQKPPSFRQHHLHQLGQLESIRMVHGSHYSAQPIDTKFNTNVLYTKYQTEQSSAGIYRSAELARIRAQKSRLIEDAKRTGRLKRAAIKLLKGAGLNKKALYALTSKTLKTDIDKASMQYIKERDVIYAKYQRRAWADWLKVKATEGESDALTALRSREIRQPLNGNIISGEMKQAIDTKADASQDNITKTGTIIYRVGTCAIRDDGEAFKISRGSSQQGLEAALFMAIKRYGKCITVKGSESFKEQITKIAATLKLDITFDDAVLEQRRQNLMQSSTTEKHHESRTQSDHERGRTNRSGHEGFGTVRTVDFTSNIQRRDRKPDGVRINKPNVGRIGHKPPPESKNRLRNLSQLGMVQLASGSKVLLPSDVLGHMEHQGAESVNKLRRDVSGAGSVNQGAIAVDKYISERKLKRTTMKDVLHHRQHEAIDQGVFKFAGLRQIDGEMLALLKQEQQIIVYPVDARTANRMKRLVIGDDVKLTYAGIVFSRGIKR